MTTASYKNLIAWITALHEVALAEGLLPKGTFLQEEFLCNTRFSTEIVKTKKKGKSITFLDENNTLKWADITSNQRGYLIFINHKII